MSKPVSVQPSLRDFGDAEFYRALKHPAIVVASRCDGERERDSSWMSGWQNGGNPASPQDA
jgi:hypothetical protein